MKIGKFVVFIAFVFSANTIYSSDSNRIMTMDQIEAVVRSIILNPPYYPRNPTHIQISLPEKFSLKALQLRIPDSQLPIISKNNVLKVGTDYGGCYLKGTGEQIYPINLSIQVYGVKNQMPPDHNLGNDTVVRWYTLGDACEVGDGSAGWVYLQQKEGKWFVVKFQGIMEFD